MYFIIKNRHVLAFGLLIGCLRAFAADGEAVALEQRASDYWAAQVSGNWGRVYDLTSPEDQARSAVKEEFVKFRSERGPFIYLSAKIGSVQTQGDTGWVKVAFESKPKEFPELDATRVDIWDVWYRKDHEWFPLPKAMRDQRPMRPPSERPAAEEAELSRRVQDLWEATKNKDWERVYRYLDPDFRGNVPKQKFLASNFNASYLSYSVDWVEVDQDSARVKISFVAKPDDPTISKMPPEQHAMIEPWVKANGHWYRQVGHK